MDQEESVETPVRASNKETFNILKVTKNHKEISDKHNIILNSKSCVYKAKRPSDLSPRTRKIMYEANLAKNLRKFRDTLP